MPFKPILSSRTAPSPFIKQPNRNINQLQSIRLPPEHDGPTGFTTFSVPPWSGHILLQPRRPLVRFAQTNWFICARVEYIPDRNEGPSLQLHPAGKAASWAHAVSCEITRVVRPQ